MTGSFLGDSSMRDLFRIEAETQTQALTSGLLALERNPGAAGPLEACMRAAHSLKGAARIVDLDEGVTLAHAMEDLLVAAQHGHTVLRREQIDLLLRGVDLINEVAHAPDAEPPAAAEGRRTRIDAFIAELSRPAPAVAVVVAEAPPPPTPETPPAPTPSPPVTVAPAGGVVEEQRSTDRALRVTVDNLNRMLGLAGESLVESRRLNPFVQSLARLKRLHTETAKAVESLRRALSDLPLDERAHGALGETQRRILESQQYLTDRLAELDASDRRTTLIAHRLYDQALKCRMRPFADGTVGLPRMVRDLGRSLGKEARLEVLGAATPVDRDMLEKLEAPLGHLLRNAVDHGIEPPATRTAAGKAAEGTVTLEAQHSAGQLLITVSDDGRGIDLDAVRGAVVKRGLANTEIAGRLSDAELLEFLFLPGFSLKGTVTEVSGRGVGLDVVKEMLREVRGIVRVVQPPGGGTRFQLQLPLTLSVVRTLIVEIGGEAYAFPLAHVVRAVKLARAGIAILEGRQYFEFDGQRISLVAAQQILDGGAPQPATGDELAIVILGGPQERYGLAVDRFLGGRELVVQPLDPRLGKVRDIAAGAVMEDGAPVLIVDVEDMIHSLAKLAQSDRLQHVRRDAAAIGRRVRKRILVVDDSLTVRELERKLLDHHGYEVEIAVDGADAWQIVREEAFDLVVTDVDMPRMGGIELVRLIRGHPDLRSLPVMILSYKDRETDQRLGLDAGADYYLTKASFQDDSFLRAVVDLVGEAVE